MFDKLLSKQVIIKGKRALVEFLKARLLSLQRNRVLTIIIN